MAYMVSASSPSRQCVPLLRRSSAASAPRGQHCFCEAVAHNLVYHTLLQRTARVLLLGCLILLAGSTASGEDLYRTAQLLRSKHSAELKQLAEWCDGQGLREQAEKLRQRFGPRDPYKTYLPVLPVKVGSEKPPADAPPRLVEWHERWTRLRRDHSNTLYGLAKRAVRQHQASLAFDLVLAAVAINPDHQPARKLLGYQEYLGRWHTLFEISKLRAGQVWHAKYGWLPKSHVTRYEQGERTVGGRWISTEEDARRHRDILSGWVVRTEHYAIRTNHSLEAGVALGAKLERLHSIWRRVFIRYYATEAQVISLFNERSRSRMVRRPPLNVVFFRDRADYNQSLRATMPGIEKSIGVYIEQTGRAYFFAGEEYEERTLYHEATHQLFHQSRPVALDVGRRANFWIVEGIAMFVETLRREGDYDVLGGFDDQRLYAARYRLLEDNFYIPLDQFTTLGMQKIQRDPRIATLYSQAAGQTIFLIYYDGGRYRDALVAYLDTVYSGRDTPSTLTDLTKTSYAELDRQYRRFLEASVPKSSTPGREQ